MKQKVKMLRTVLGCDDGVVVPTTFHEKQEYEVGESLLAEFVNMAAVELVFAPSARQTKVVAPEETKPADVAEIESPEADEPPKPAVIAVKPAAKKK